MAEKKMHTKSLPGSDDIHRQTLPNGITILSRSNFNSPSVVISGYFATGALFELDEQLGLADFVCSSLMRGTARHDMQQVYDALESVGAGLGYDSGTYTSSFHGRSLAEDLPLLLDLLAETIRTPSFPGEQVERLRAQLLTGLAIRAQDTADMSDLIFDEILFEGHPYSRPEDGWPETIQAITRKDLMDFHQQTFGPRGMVIAVVGVVEPERAVEFVHRFLGGWKNPAQKERLQIPGQAPLKKTKRRVYKVAGKNQSDLIIGTLGPKRSSPDFLPASLGNSILGQFGMMGRIGRVVRERSGLAYYASSSLSTGLGPGSWSVAAGVNPMNVEKAVNLVISELRRFVKGGVTKQELSDNQDNYVGRLPLSMESNGGVAGALINIERNNLDLDYYRNYERSVRAVKRQEIQEVAAKYIDPDRLAIAIAGP